VAAVAAGSGNPPERQTPFEDTLASVQAPLVSGEDIRKYVNVNLSRLERFVERELYFREASEQIEGESVTKDEVIDEAIARALGRRRREARAARSRTLAIPARLALHGRHGPGAHEHNGSVHLEDSARQRNVRASDEAELQFHQPDEAILGATVIADRRVSTPEQTRPPMKCCAWSRRLARHRPVSPRGLYPLSPWKALPTTNRRDH